MSGVAPVSVVIVTWNSIRYLGACLDSLGRLDRPAARVIVVDSASSDGTVEWLGERYPRVHRIPCRDNVGFCRGNNLGFAASDTPFVLALNPDTWVEPDFLERLLPAFDDARVGIACGKLLRFDRRTLDSAGQQLGRARRPVDRGYGRPDTGQFDRDEEVFGACGAAALYRRAMLESIVDPGGEYFTEDFFAFGEDLDLAWRAQRRGWRAVYRHSAVAYHARGATARGSTRLRRWSAMLGRSPEIRYHVAKNRYLTLLRNDSVAGYLANLPFIWARDAAVVAMLTLTAPGVLGRLWRNRALFAAAWRRRRLDAERQGNHVAQDRSG